MSERLYLQDAYLATFSANIVERMSLPVGRLAVVLDRTAFHPGTGGLPADRGWLNHAQVSGVFVREGDGEILHVLAEEIWENQVQARIDWPRRLDVMRQHTGGHLLAQAFVEVCGAAACGITVSEQEAALDLDRLDVPLAQIEQVETAVNEAVWSDGAIRVASVNAAQASQIGLTPPAGATWPLQVVSVKGAGVTICDGVHVARAGEVGLVKLLGCESQGDRLRVRFACGARALAEFRRASHSLDQIARHLGTSAESAMSVIAHLTSEANAARTERAALGGKMIDLEAQVLAANAEPAGGVRVVRRVYAERERDVAELRQLARLVMTKPDLVVLLGIAGDKAQLLFARSANVSHDMTVFVRAAAQVLGSQGGGQPALAESTPARADEARVKAAIAKAFKLLQAQR